MTIAKNILRGVIDASISSQKFPMHNLQETKNPSRDGVFVSQPKNQGLFLPLSHLRANFSDEVGRSIFSA